MHILYCADMSWPAEHEMRPFLVQKRLLHLSYTSVKPGAYNAHKYMHGSTVGLLISKVHGLLKFPRFQPIGSMRTVLIKTLRYCWILPNVRDTET
jgi:hypothetical protein